MGAGWENVAPIENGLELNPGYMAVCVFMLIADVGSHRWWAHHQEIEETQKIYTL